MEVFQKLIKKTKFIPVYKKGDRTDPDNYRPIANIPSFAKFSEKIINEKLVAYLVRQISADK